VPEDPKDAIKAAPNIGKLKSEFITTGNKRRSRDYRSSRINCLRQIEEYTERGNNYDERKNIELFVNEKGIII